MADYEIRTPRYSNRSPMHLKVTIDLPAGVKIHTPMALTLEVDGSAIPGVMKDADPE